jgi:hypothetical protein
VSATLVVVLGGEVSQLAVVEDDQAAVLLGVNLQAWHVVVAMVADVQLTNQRDRFMWGLHQNGFFSVKSMYKALLGSEAIPYNTLI